MTITRHALLPACLAGALTMSLLPATAAGQTHDYTFVQGGLAYYPGASIHDTSSQDYVGVDLKGAYEITPDIFALGGLKYLNDDYSLTSLHAGGAYRVTIDERIDIYGGPTLEYQRLSNGGSDTELGLGLRGGLRLQLNPELELGGEMRVVTGDADYVGLTGTAAYALNNETSVIAEADLYDGELGLIGGVRLTF